MGIFLIVKLSMGVFELLAAKERVGEAEREVEILKEEQAEIAENLEYYRSDLFVEREIRDKLGLSKPGEVVVLVPDDLPVLSSGEEGTDEENLANWEKWLKLFLWQFSSGRVYFRLKYAG